MNAQHVDVYREPGRFGGWPANHGIWSWDDEILVGFSAGHTNLEGGFHKISKSKPEEHLLARSVDGGETWNIENPANKGPWIGAMEGRGNFPHEPPLVEVTNKIDFTAHDFCMTCRMVAPSSTKKSRIYYSCDRGMIWKGPFELPDFKTTGVAARTDYIVGPTPDSCMLFLTAMKSNGREGRPFVAETNNGGNSWNFVSWICGEQPTATRSYAIMPSTVQINADELLTVIRHQGKRHDSPAKCWLESYRSLDAGSSWSLGQIVVPRTGNSGNPGHLLKLSDGRLVITFAKRSRRTSSEILVIVSNDNGEIWGEPIMLRKQYGASPDVGYTRSVQRLDGRIVTIYYFCEYDDLDRTIQATIWEA